MGQGTARLSLAPLDGVRVETLALWRGLTDAVPLGADHAPARFCSPFLRTVQTASLIADVLDLPVRIEHGLCEWLNPRWFRRAPPLASPEDLCSRFPRIDRAYRSILKPRYPETSEQAYARAGEAACLLAEEYGGDLLLVGHGHSVTGMAWGLLEHRPVIHANICALIRLERRGGRWHLALNGDTAHLGSSDRPV